MDIQDNGATGANFNASNKTVAPVKITWLNHSIQPFPPVTTFISGHQFPLSSHTFRSLSSFSIAQINTTLFIQQPASQVVTTEVAKQYPSHRKLSNKAQKNFLKQQETILADRGFSKTEAKKTIKSWDKLAKGNNYAVEDWTKNQPYKDGHRQQWFNWSKNQFISKGYHPLEAETKAHSALKTSGTDYRAVEKSVNAEQKPKGLKTVEQQKKDDLKWGVEQFKGAGYSQSVSEQFVTNAQHIYGSNRQGFLNWVKNVPKAQSTPLEKTPAPVTASATVSHTPTVSPNTTIPQQPTTARERAVTTPDSMTKQEDSSTPSRPPEQEGERPVPAKRRAKSLSSLPSSATLATPESPAKTQALKSSSQPKASSAPEATTKANSPPASQITEKTDPLQQKTTSAAKSKTAQPVAPLRTGLGSVENKQQKQALKTLGLNTLNSDALNERTFLKMMEHLPVKEGGKVKSEQTTYTDILQAHQTLTDAVEQKAALKQKMGSKSKRGNASAGIGKPKGLSSKASSAIDLRIAEKPELSKTPLSPSVKSIGLPDTASKSEILARLSEIAREHMPKAGRSHDDYKAHRQEARNAWEVYDLLIR